MSNERALYNPNDGLTGRGGGPYLDQEEDRLAEERRARIEGREPDLENPPASGGTVLVTAGQLLANQGVNNLPSVTGSVAQDQELAVKSLSDNEDTALKARAVLPDEAFTPADAGADLSIRSALMTDGEMGEGEKNTEPNKDRQAAAKKTTAAVKKTTSKKTTAKSKNSTAPKSSSDRSEDPAGTRSTAK